jgi:hypothetical protein
MASERFVGFSLRETQTLEHARAKPIVRALSSRDVTGAARQVTFLPYFKSFSFFSMSAPFWFFGFSSRDFS